MFISIYPPLNNYLKNVLIEVSTLLTAVKLKKIEIRLYDHLDKNDASSSESYFIEINNEMHEALDEDNVDEDLLTEFRSCIHSLEIKSKSLKKLSKNCRFKMFLHVLSHDYMSGSRCQDFLWVEDNESSKSHDVGDLTPINMTSRSNCVKFYIEDNKNKA